MKQSLLKYQIVFTIMALMSSCKKDIKNDFLWESVNTEDRTLETTKPKDSDFEFDTETEAIKTNQNDIKIKPEVKIIDGTLISNNPYNLYDTDGQLLHLVATKLCWDFDYKKVFGDFRNGRYKNGKDPIKIDNCCSAFIPSPYIEPMEYYYSQYHNINDISNYQNNVFKLKEIRKNMLDENYESFKKLVMSVNPDNLVSYKLVTSTIQSYDFDKGELIIKYYINKNQRIGRSSSSVIRTPNGNNRYSSSYSYLIKMEEKDAKSLFEHYTSLNEYNKNPPFKLTTKTTFSLQIPKLEKRPYPFESRINKIEFYKQGEGYPNEQDKIGEIQFNY